MAIADMPVVNDELVAKLQSEISMEEDMKEDEDLSANIKEYLENSPFEVQPSPRAVPMTCH
jgi:complement component 1 Q subcomponent-binding protein